tara:strand:+ start:201 stop:347 length:147 start_codon:yes stop_codon:yes gene_type:complete
LALAAVVQPMAQIVYFLQSQALVAVEAHFRLGRLLVALVVLVVLVGRL